MDNNPNTLPDAHFGVVSNTEPDKLPEVADNDTDDDEELDETPKDVVDILGFDPAEQDE